MNTETLKYIKEDPKRLFSMLGSKGLLNWVPDKLYIKIQFRLAMGKWPDLKNPQTFNEKLQWLKLHDRNPLYTTLVDKYAVRQYIADKIGEEYLIPLVGGPWKNTDEIDFDTLPEQFVLKCNHDSGGVIVCRDKSRLDVEAARAKLNKRLGVNYYFANREWPYKNVEPCIFAEQYMENHGTDLSDYKWYCFDGEPKFLLITEDRNNEGELTKYNYFDMDYTALPFYNSGPHSKVLPQKPESFARMRAIAEKLGEGFSHIRVDLYEVGDKIFFGELTLYDSSGMEKFDPSEWDKTIGSWLTLPDR